MPNNMEIISYITYFLLFFILSFWCNYYKFINAVIIKSFNIYKYKYKWIIDNEWLFCFGKNFLKNWFSNFWIVSFFKNNRFQTWTKKINKKSEISVKFGVELIEFNDEQ